MLKLESIDDYSKWVDYHENIELYKHNCELCGEIDFDVILTHTDAGNSTLVPLPVSRCTSCGYLMQNPRPSEQFYDDFYNKLYAKMRLKSSSYSKDDPNNADNNKGIGQLDEDGLATDVGFQNAYQRSDAIHSYL